MSKTMTPNPWTCSLVTGLLCAAGMAQANPAPSTRSLAPSRPALTAAVKDYLADHGDLCVGKFTWPRDVTDADRQAGTNDAVQLPVMERLGLVESQVLPAVIPTSARSTDGHSTPAAGRITRYSLTAKGRQFYLQKKTTFVGVHTASVERSADLCLAHLSLDKVIRWTPPAQVHGHLESVVWYTYKIKSADWMSDPRARKVFPVVARIIRGQGNLLMTATVQAHNGTWLPVLPGQ